MATYEQKKASCEERMIEFNFTKQEWKKFNDMKKFVTCAYTNVAFVHEVNHLHQPTCERLSEDLGYSVQNCVWVTKHANDLKSTYIENRKDTSKLNEHDSGLVRRIERIVNSVDCLNRIQEPYRKIFNSIKPQENNILNEKTTPIESVNPEIRIAQLFAAMGSFIENKCDAKFELTYIQFKTLISRKRCQFTGEDLPEDLGNRRLWVKDKSLPVTNDNVIVCGKDLAQALDTLVVSANINFKQLQKIAKVLSK